MLPYYVSSVEHISCPYPICKIDFKEQLIFLIPLHLKSYVDINHTNFKEQVIVLIY